MKTIAAVLLLASTTLAAEMRAHRDLPYAEPNHSRQTLDVYAPQEGADHPVVVWIHGGGWRQGDKALSLPTFLQEMRRRCHRGAMV